MFKVGDKIVCIDTGVINNVGTPAYELKVGQVYNVQAVVQSKGVWFVKTKEKQIGYKAARFAPVRLTNKERIEQRRAKHE